MIQACAKFERKYRDSTKRTSIIHQKTVCNRRKPSYNLAERENRQLRNEDSPGPDTGDAYEAIGDSEASSIAKGHLRTWSCLKAPGRRTMATACRHPKVRIVSRHDDNEFVECMECGEVFDSEEFRDMEIEDTAGAEDVKDDS